MKISANTLLLITGGLIVLSTITMFAKSINDTSHRVNQCVVVEYESGTKKDRADLYAYCQAKARVTDD